MDYSFLLSLVTSGAGLLAGKSGKGKAGDAWQTAAETYGLLYKPASFWSGPKLAGSLAGNELTVDIKDRNTASAATRFRLRTPSRNLGLRLRKKGFWNSLGPRTLTGDRGFDSQVVATGVNGIAVREFLTPERRKAVQSFLGSFKRPVVTDDEISFTTRGQVKKPEEMLGAIDAMMHVARALSDETSSMSVSPGEGAAAAAAAIAATAAVETVAPQPEPALEAEPEPAPAPEPEPEPNLADVNEPDPQSELEPKPRNEQTEQTDAPAALTDPEGEATAVTDSLRSQENTPGVEEFCATVFAPGALSFTANQKFKESYAGERVVWTGTLESMTPFTFDFDFGSGGGTKAVLTILESDAAGSRNVEAVIGLPPGFEGLDDRIGQPVSFSGRLLKVDGLAKRVVIADAELQP